MRIFLIEDATAAGDMLDAASRDAGWRVVRCAPSAHLPVRLHAEQVDAVLLDYGDGIDTCNASLRGLRAAGIALPVLAVTGPIGVQERLSILNAGADDYLIKPFERTELLARLRSVIEVAARPQERGDPCWRVGALALYERRMQVTLDGTSVALSKTEFALLQTLIRQAGHVITRAELEERVLAGAGGKTLDVHIFNLRRKIGDGRLRTVRGIGYVLEFST